jgi:hypothetical protein
MKSSQFLGEGFVEDAHSVHQDHEVQMAREELYHSAEYALRLHKLLRNVSEEQGLEGWVSAKITLANDYLKTVLDHIEYQLMSGATGPGDANSSAEVMPIAEGAEFGAKYAEQVAQQIFNKRQDISSEAEVLNQAYHIVADEQGQRSSRYMFNYDADFPSDLVSAYFWLQKSQGVAEGHADQQRKVFKKNGKPIGEVGIDRESSPGVGQWYIKHYASGTDQVGYDSYEEAVEELKHYLKQGMAETSAGNIAAVVNPPAKNKAKVGTLFGGTYKQPKAK